MLGSLDLDHPARAQVHGREDGDVVEVTIPSHDRQRPGGLGALLSLLLVFSSLAGLAGAAGGGFVGGPSAGSVA